MFEKRKLKKALLSNDVAAARAALTANRSLRYTDINHYRPLYWAINRKQDEMAIMLIEEFGDNPSNRLEYKPNAFFYMAMNGRLDLFKRYEEAYSIIIKTSLVDRSEWTLLHHAAYYGHGDFVRHLVEKGMDIKAKSDDGATPVYYAQKNGYQDIVAFLLDEEQKLAAINKEKEAQPTVAQKGWQKLDDQRIAHVREDKAIGYRFTEIFNFAAGDVTRISQNLVTKAESSAIARISADSADCRAAAAQLGISLDSKTTLLTAKSALPS